MASYLFHIFAIAIFVSFFFYVRFFINRKRNKKDPDEIIGNYGTPMSVEINEFGGFVKVVDEHNIEHVIRAKTYNSKIVKKDERVLVTSFDKTDDFFIVDKFS